MGTSAPCRNCPLARKLSVGERACRTPMSGSSLIGQASMTGIERQADVRRSMLEVAEVPILLQKDFGPTNQQY
jgi:hypothetical protein